MTMAIEFPDSVALRMVRDKLARQTGKVHFALLMTFDENGDGVESIIGSEGLSPEMATTLLYKTAVEIERQAAEPT